MRSSSKTHKPRHLNLPTATLGQLQCDDWSLLSVQRLGIAEQQSLQIFVRLTVHVQVTNLIYIACLLAKSNKNCERLKCTYTLMTDAFVLFDAAFQSSMQLNVHNYGTSRHRHQIVWLQATSKVCGGQRAEVMQLLIDIIWQLLRYGKGGSVLRA